MRFLHSKIFLLLIVWRVSSVFIVQTSHVPDEYWQSLEVAHKLAFDYGYLTWEWRTGIRSYLYPFLISILYSIAKFLHIDNIFVIITLPRIFQAVLTAFAEYRFYIWTQSKLALFNLVINWYWYYCATRTLINSFETCLTLIALSYYPWKENPRKHSVFLWIVGFLCFARPTSVLIWLPLCLYHLYKSKAVLKSYISIGLCCLVISIVIDTLCYRKFILTPLEFFKVNVIHRISEQYGKMHFMWYFISGLPVLLGINYILLPYAVYQLFKNQYHISVILYSIAIWNISLYSLLAHKEFRFILPVLPMLIYILNESIFSPKLADYKKKLFILILISTNAIPGFFFSVVHQQGALNVMKNLRVDIEHNKDSDIDILFLTTCHATPYYSHLHKNVSMRFLTCEPNLKGIKDYRDETDEFFANPMKWLKLNYLNKTDIALPSHVITFDSTVEDIKPFLKYYKNLNKSLNDICKALDDLTIKNLELTEEKVELTVQLENILRQGHIDLAKARYIRGKESVGLLQIPNEDIEISSLFDLETTYTKTIPVYDISLKELKAQDPIKWFGVLVPQSLKSAQKHFQDAVYLSVKLANVQSELVKINEKSNMLRSLKKVPTEAS